jgi:hypothetical protein
MSASDGVVIGGANDTGQASCKRLAAPRAWVTNNPGTKDKTKIAIADNIPGRSNARLADCPSADFQKRRSRTDGLHIQGNRTSVADFGGAGP